MTRKNFILATIVALIAIPAIPSQAEASGGRYCREYTRTITVGRELYEGYGTACMQPDGSWEIVSEQAPRLPVVTREVFYETAPVRIVTLQSRNPFIYHPPRNNTILIKFRDNDRRGHGHYDRHRHSHHHNHKHDRHDHNRGGRR